MTEEERLRKTLMACAHWLNSEYGPFDWSNHEIGPFEDFDSALEWLSKFSDEIYELWKD